jgi:hypothetical protein
LNNVQHFDAHYRRADIGTQAAVRAGLQLQYFFDAVIVLRHDRINIFGLPVEPVGPVGPV